MFQFAVADWRIAILVILGCAASTVAGRALGVSVADVSAGLQGLCGALVGAATFLIVGAQLAAHPIAVVGGALCAPITCASGWRSWLFAFVAAAVTAAVTVLMQRLPVRSLPGRTS